MSLDIGGSARLRSPGAGYEVRGRHPARYREGTPRIGGNQTTRSSPDCDRVTRTASVVRSRRLASMAAPPSRTRQSFRSHVAAADHGLQRRHHAQLRLRRPLNPCGGLMVRPAVGRPFGIALLSVLIIIGGALDIIAGIVAISLRGDGVLLVALEGTEDEVTALGIGFIVVGVLAIVVGTVLWNGSPFARTLVGTVVLARLIATIRSFAALDPESSPQHGCNQPRRRTKGNGRWGTASTMRQVRRSKFTATRWRGAEPGDPSRLTCHSWLSTASCPTPFVRRGMPPTFPASPGSA